MTTEEFQAKHGFNTKDMEVIKEICRLLKGKIVKIWEVKDGSRD